MIAGTRRRGEADREHSIVPMIVTDFPVLTRSKRISPKTLAVLKCVDTLIVRRSKAAETLLTQIGDTELASLPQAVEDACGPNHPELAKVLHKIAVLYHSTYSIGKAEITYRNALACAEKAFPQPTLEVGLLLNNFGRLLHEQRKLPEAAEMYERSLQVLKQAVGPYHRKLGTPMSNLADLYMETGKPELSKALLQDLIVLLKMTLGANHRRVVKAQERLALLGQ